jgi:hypothetical protein
VDNGDRGLVLCPVHRINLYLNRPINLVEMTGPLYQIKNVIETYSKNMKRKVRTTWMSDFGENDVVSISKEGIGRMLSERKGEHVNGSDDKPGKLV